MMKSMFLICAAVVALIAAGCAVYKRALVRRAVRTTAVVRAITPLGGNGQRLAQVEFADPQGQLHLYPAQRYGMKTVREGDTVNILYIPRKALGMESFQIFILAHKKANPLGIYTIASVLLAAVAAGFTLLAMTL